MVLPLQIDKKVVKYIILWHTFTGKCNATIIIEGKDYTYIKHKLYWQKLTLEMEEIACNKCFLENKSIVSGW